MPICCETRPATVTFRRNVKLTPTDHCHCRNGKRVHPLNANLTIENSLSHELVPICPRDDHHMRYEAHGISWKGVPTDQHLQTLPSYHCGFEGCSVRYDLLNGYFTVVLTPEQPYFIEEPGVNLLRCPLHGTWLYRVEVHEHSSRYAWRCGVLRCDYVYPRGAT